MASAVVIVIAIISFFLAFAVGSNDAANGLATSYGSRAAPLKYLLIGGAIFEFIGAYFCSSKVAAALPGKVITNISDYSEIEQDQMMIGTSVSCFLFIIGSSFIGMPISGTTTIVAGLIGAGLVAVFCYPVNYGINWVELATIVAYWVISPLVACLISLSLFSLVCYLTLDGSKWSLAARIRWLTLIAGVSLTFLALLVASLTWPGRGKSPDEGKTIYGSQWYDWVINLICGLVGMLLVRIFLINKIEQPMSLGRKMFILFNLFEAQVFVEEINFFNVRQSQLSQQMKSQVSVQDDEIAQNTIRNANQMTNNFDHLNDYEDAEQKSDSEASLNEQLDPLKKSLRQSGSQNTRGSFVNSMHYKEGELLTEAYRALMLLTAMIVCLGHGANDVANSISPFLVVLSVYGDSNQIGYAVGGVGIAVGLLLFGARVIKTLGDKILVLDFAKGFSSQFGTAVCIIVGTEFGIPLSTTHCAVGGISGLIVAQKLSYIQRVYGEGSSEEEKKKVNMKTFGKILLWWLLNLPIVIASTLFITWIIYLCWGTN